MVLNMNLTAVGDEIPPWLEQRMGLTIDAMRSANAAGLLQGTPDQMAQTLQRRRDVSGISYVCAGADHAERLAPVVELLRGQ